MCRFAFFLRNRITPEIAQFDPAHHPKPVPHFKQLLNPSENVTIKNSIPLSCSFYIPSAYHGFKRCKPVLRRSFEKWERKRQVKTFLQSFQSNMGQKVFLLPSLTRTDASQGPTGEGRRMPALFWRSPYHQVVCSNLYSVCYRQWTNQDQKNR